MRHAFRNPNQAASFRSRAKLSVTTTSSSPPQNRPTLPCRAKTTAPYPSAPAWVSRLVDSLSSSSSSASASYGTENEGGGPFYVISNAATPTKVGLTPRHGMEVAVVICSRHLSVRDPSAAGTRAPSVPARNRTWTGHSLATLAHTPVNTTVQSAQPMALLAPPPVATGQHSHNNDSSKLSRSSLRHTGRRLRHSHSGPARLRRSS